MKEKLQNLRNRYRRYEPVIFFGAGFLFDVFTLRRIDDWIKLWFQVAFLVLLGIFLLLEYRESKPEFRVPNWLSKAWHFRLEIVHFLFGSMLSAYVIFYFKSASVGQSGVFLALLMLLMLLNELPNVRNRGLMLRVILYGFCASSFLIYFFPVIAGHISSQLFVAAIGCGTLMTFILIYLMARSDGVKSVLAWPDILNKMGVGVLAVQLTLATFYFLKIIPPVPLSMTFAGVYHKIEKTGTVYNLHSLRPWYRFWTHGDSLFLNRPGDALYCFVRVFAPAQFSHKVTLHWLLYTEGKNGKSGQWITQDKIPMQVSGGREEGFRGVAFKSHFQTGQWRINVETEDGREIGHLKFNIEDDPSNEPRQWRIEED